MTKTEVEILKEFKDVLKRNSSDISSMYHHLFSILSEEELTKILIDLQNIYNEDKEDWFYSFHKSIRQCDFFGDNLQSYRIINKLTEEQTKRRRELMNIRKNQFDTEFKSLSPEEKMEDYLEFNKREDRVESLKELKILNDLYRTKEEVSIAGHLDMLLWNTIHLDRENELQKIFERTFKLIS